MIGIDTFSWKKIIKLKNNKTWEGIITEILTHGEFFITHEGKKEFRHFFPSEIDLLESTSILPVIKSEIYFNHLSDNFDPNDASLLEYSEKKNYLVITEDVPMLIIGNLFVRRTIQIIDYFYILLNDGFLNSREFYHLTKFLRKWKNISKKKEKYYLNIIR